MDTEEKVRLGILTETTTNQNKMWRTFDPGPNYEDYFKSLPVIREETTNAGSN